MRQVLHLFVVHADRGAAAAARFGPRWLLPVLTCGERVRADRLALRWACSHGIDAVVAGQWLGRVTRDATDWLIVLSTARDVALNGVGLSWMPLDALAPAAALLDYQAWAVARSLERGPLPRVSGPFGRLGWNAEVLAWIERATGSPCGAVTPYRTGAHEVVLGAHAASGPVYFKGLMPARAVEARLTRTLSAFEPSRFAPTLALEQRDDGTVWWLAAGCPGKPAVEGRGVASGLASVQRRVMSWGPVLRELPVLDVTAVFGWAATLVGDGESAAALEPHVEAVTNAGVPSSWIPMDLDPVNVLADAGGEVRFIDLDDSFLGPAPLAMALFARRSGIRSDYRTYEACWSPPLGAVDWTAFEVAAGLIDGWLGWRRVCRNARRGDVYGALEAVEACLRDRLVRAVQGR